MFVVYSVVFMTFENYVAKQITFDSFGADQATYILWPFFK